MTRRSVPREITHTHPDKWIKKGTSSVLIHDLLKFPTFVRFRREYQWTSVSQEDISDEITVDNPTAKDVNQITKCESQSVSFDTEITPDDGDDLIPFMSQGPKVFYGYADALLDIFQFGENEGPYWLKSMVMDRYKTSASGDQR